MVAMGGGASGESEHRLPRPWPVRPIGWRLLFFRHSRVALFFPCIILINGNGANGQNVAATMLEMTPPAADGEGN